ncbi:MAG: alkyl sulfatase dimerization domain-containing protein [Bacteroidota bacterium]
MNRYLPLALHLLLSFFLFSAINACKESTVRIPIAPAQSIEEVHQQILKDLDFGDNKDFERAKRGFIGTREDPIIKDANGNIVMDLSAFDFMEADAPNTVNPSLWRQGQLNRMHGLYKVREGIYQVRGFDLANMTVVATDNGWIVIDPLMTTEIAEAAMDLVDTYLGKKPVKALLITHSHVDHFGGMEGIVSKEKVEEGEVEIIAPAGFYESAISENIIAGNAMSRRAAYMFGSLLPSDTNAYIGSGLGQKLSVGTVGIIKPTILIEETGQKANIDGLEMVFQFTPEAEAPAECMFYFPQYKAFCQAEEINHTLHNLYTLRGAEVRSGLKWAKYLDESIQMFSKEVEISFGSHHWPTWGQEDILELWAKQRDIYKFIHDQTLYLANNGYTMLEIAEMIELPESLSSFFANRGYYGTVSHNAKAQYQLYFGWFDGNPANLHALPPTEAAKKYISYMGGAEAILPKLKQDIEKGEFRWAAMVLNHLIFAEPDHQEARSLLSEVYTQMAYMAESGPWRNFYLTGAQELQEGITRKYAQGELNREDIISKVSLGNLYDYLAVRLDRTKAKGKEYSFNLIFPDTQESISLYLVNEVLHNRPGILAENPNTTISMNRSVFNDILLKKTSAFKKFMTGDIKIEGNRDDYSDFQGMIESPFVADFNIIEP